MNWDDDKFEPPSLTTANKKFDDEENPDDIPDAWDEEPPKKAAPKEEPKETKPVEVKKEPKPAHKSSKKPVVVNEKRAEELDPFAEKAKRQQAVEESDFHNTQDMFSGLDSVSLINTANPKDEKDFNVLAESLAKKLVLFEKSIHYKGFLKNLTKQLVNPLKSEEIKELAASLTVVANEKLKSEKTDKITKKKKATKKISKNVDDEEEDGFVEGEYDEYADFM